MKQLQPRWVIAALLTTVGTALLVLWIAPPQQRVDQDELRRMLMDRLRSGENDTAQMAAEDLAYYGWLTDGSLEGIDLSGANLVAANLIGANLPRANLQNADLGSASLNRAQLPGANFADANLYAATLTGSSLHEANFSGADLRVADLKNADLSGANLTGASLSGAQWNESTRLPDGSMWSPETDLGRFTDAQHPDYWQPEDGR